MYYKDAETIECATEWAILIDSLTPCRNILLGLATAFTCSVEAELLEIEIMSIDEIEKQKQSRKKHYYDGNDEKLAVCKDRGANVCINYKMEDFVKRVKEETVKLVENAYKLHFWEYLGYHGKERTLQRTRKQLFVALWGHV
ncbi:uncharacterized protein LOC142637416 isoform X2 [Castanea sativa]